MKGGRTAPRNFSIATRLPQIQSFNEGGADCPPKHPQGERPKPPLPCFNEGGADCPPKPDLTETAAIGAICFNEGGADCPPKL